MNTFLKLEEAYEMEPPKYLLSSFETIDQVIQTLVSVGYERKDDVYKEVPIGDLVVDSAGDGQFRVTRFGVEPKVALCSHSQFGNLDSSSGLRMRGALEILDSAKRDFLYEGEMHSDSALDAELRSRILPNSRFDGSANVLVFSNTDAASGVRNILKMCANGIEVGPILMGMGNKAHIVTPSITARGLLNIATLAGTPVKEYG